MIEQPENLCLGDLIAKRVPFIIPPYQRTYAWDSDEIDDYIRDLEEIYNDHNQQGTMTHFFGGIVSFEERAPNTSTRRIYNVIDGQQRLATFMITLSLLIKHLRKIADDAAKEGDTQAAESATAYAQKADSEFLKYQEVKGGKIQSKLRLMLSKADADYFLALMDHHILSGTKESHKRLKHAYDKIDSFIDNLISKTPIQFEKKLECLLLLQTCITEECFVILIVSNNEDEAYRLFSILNDRGKTLSDGDKLRSYTLEFLEYYPRLQERVEKYWDSILGRKDSVIDEFLKYYYTSYEGKRAPARDISGSYLKSPYFFSFSQRQLPRERENEAIQVANKIEQMQIEQQIYIELSDGEWPYENPSASDWDKNRLKLLIKILRHKKCIPLLLSAKQYLPEQFFAELINLLERFVFRYITIVSGHNGKLDEIYYTAAKDIREKGASYNLELLKTKLKDIQDKHAPNDSFISQLNEKLKYNNQNVQSGNLNVKYFFSTLEDYYNWYSKGAKKSPRSEKIMTFDLKVLNIEHIYPQNPKGADKILGFPTDNIGNLSIWSPGENSSAGNGNFAEKKHRYNQSNIKLNNYLATLSKWDMEELEKRKSMLFDMATKIFTA